MTGMLISRPCGLRDTQKEERCVKMEAETGVMQLKVKEPLGLWAITRSQKGNMGYGNKYIPFRGKLALHSLIADFQPLGL